MLKNIVKILVIFDKLNPITAVDMCVAYFDYIYATDNLYKGFNDRSRIL